MTMPSIRDQEFEEDEWDPSGVNAMTFTTDGDDAEADKDAEDEDDDDLEASEVLVVEDEDDESADAEDPTDLDVDGLTELERMEKRLRLEDDPLEDFAMIVEEE
jgi:hypothetical protein